MKEEAFWNSALSHCPRDERAGFLETLARPMDAFGISRLIHYAQTTRSPEDFLVAFLRTCRGKLTVAAESFILEAIAGHDFRDAAVAQQAASILFREKRWSLALTYGQKVVLLRPDDWNTQFQNGVIEVLRKKPAAAREHFLSVESIHANMPQNLANLASVNALLCDWENREDHLNRLHQLVDSTIEGPSPVFLNPFEGGGITRDPEKTLETATARASRIRKAHPPVKWPFPEANQNRRIRIGYLSADFRDHPVSHLLAAVLPLHNRGEFEVFGYPIGSINRDAYYKTFESGLEHMVPLTGMNIHEQAARIAADSLDILIDLGGYSVGARPEILSLRPAPCQIQFLGYASTMGAPFVDGYIADSFCLPNWLEKAFSERIHRLPGSFMPPGKAFSITGPRPLPSTYGFDEKDRILCVFNATYKMDPAVFKLWIRILKAIPEAKLWLKFKPQEAFENLRKEAIKEGVDPERLVFETKKLPEEEHMQRLRCADLFLDTPLYNAHATAVMILKAGIPILTVPGRTMASRIAGSLLNALGLHELIMKDGDDYVKTAIRLLQDQSRLEECRKNVEKVVTESDVLDPSKYILKWESLLKSIHEGR